MVNIEDFSLDRGGDVIPWRLFTPEDAGQGYCVLWLQGWSSSMDSHRDGAERLARQTGTVFVTMDPAGHGRHKLALEESTRRQQHEEVLAVFDELRKRGYAKIIVTGTSFGGYQTALLTGQRPVHAAILRAPANYPDDEFDMPYKDTPRSKDYAAYAATKESDDRLADSAAIQALRRYDGFVYVLEHELDEVVPAKIPRRYFQAARHGNYLIIPATPHSAKTLPDPEPHFAYIEHLVASLIQAIRLQDGL